MLHWFSLPRFIPLCVSVHTEVGLVYVTNRISHKWNPSLGHQWHWGFCLLLPLNVSLQKKLTAMPWHFLAALWNGERNWHLPTTTNDLSATHASPRGIVASSPGQAFGWMRLHATPYQTLNQNNWVWTAKPPPNTWPTESEL